VRPVIFSVREMNECTLQQLRVNNEDDIAVLQSLLDAAPAYSLIVEGELPSPSAAKEMFEALPPGKTAADKFVFEIRSQAGPIGCVDFIRGYPEEHVAFIGLILLIESAQGRSYGPQALCLLETLAKSWDCTTIRIAVIDTNVRALAFWHREGFVELVRKDSVGFTGAAIIMERSLTRHIC